MGGTLLQLNARLQETDLFLTAPSCQARGAPYQGAEQRRSCHLTDSCHSRVFTAPSPGHMGRQFTVEERWERQGEEKGAGLDPQFVSRLTQGTMAARALGSEGRSRSLRHRCLQLLGKGSCRAFSQL